MAKKCKAQRCDRLVKVKGFCQMHYQRGWNRRFDGKTEKEVLREKKEHEMRIAHTKVFMGDKPDTVI
ncbi:MAG: hypothetical protein ACE5H1_01955 [Thermodesulfobacteriota bacterium]